MVKEKQGVGNGWGKWLARAIVRAVDFAKVENPALRVKRRLSSALEFRFTISLWAWLSF
jgi:hypothetical protein